MFHRVSYRRCGRGLSGSRMAGMVPQYVRYGAVGWSLQTFAAGKRAQIGLMIRCVYRTLIRFALLYACARTISRPLATTTVAIWT
jgi:hypothetical protein